VVSSWIPPESVRTSRADIIKFKNLNTLEGQGHEYEGKISLPSGGIMEKDLFPQPKESELLSSTRVHGKYNGYPICDHCRP